ncbi:Cyclic pyranopterin monophosphate synthase [subsurface metagenome]
MKLSHIDKSGKPVMVDVSAKPYQKRVAKARGFIKLQKQTLSLIQENNIKKGNVLITAQIAGIQAAKKTSELIPLCHPLALKKVEVDAKTLDSGIQVDSLVTCIEQTGVEMEALQAVSTALLTIYDMCKAVDKEMILENIHLVEKTKEPVKK